MLATAGAVLVTLTVAAELGARGLIHHRVASAAAKRLGTDPDVETGGLSALAGLVGRHLPYVELSAEDAVIGKVRGAAPVPGPARARRPGRRTGREVRASPPSRP
ncbi:hypothetical protein [Streptomyces sp. GC420]|uniref:hypothetical protein n=1 Tax=Streptomyces sp. GC420 TaxID=2697568 RepID=UPI0014151FF7|nr:hypothetical protein [Streptomyces sp. GC420]NBM19230.1 hypothetical protein [Streptomyces sp. GC420]